MGFGMRWKPVKAALLGSVCVLFAAPAWAQLGGYESDQGAHLSGTVDGRYERLGIPLDSARYQGARIEASLEDGALVGRTGSGPLRESLFRGVSFSTKVGLQTVTFTVDATERHLNVYTGEPSKTAWEYQVTWESPDGKGRLCPEGRPALALPGRWKGGVFMPSEAPAMLSFACVPGTRMNADGSVQYAKGGVAAKCVDWGFPPWLNKDGLPGNGVSPAASLDEALRYHASCVAMATADYCGEARPNTVEGTPIVMFHPRNVEAETRPGSTARYIANGPFGSGGQFFFEAAWTAVPIHEGRSVNTGLRPKALCLNKRRWSTLPLNGACLADTDFVPDPRAHRAQLQPPRTCEELSQSELLAQGAVLFSYSTYIDAGLYRFVNPKTSAYLTTSAVVVEDEGPLHYPASYKPAPSIAGAEDFVLDTGSTWPVYEGPVLSPNAPASFAGLKYTRPLLRYRATAADGSARFVTLVEGAQAPDGFVFDGVEGHVYVGAPLADVPSLRLWQKGTDFLATSGDMAAQGYLDRSGQAPMGSLPSMNTYSQLP